MVKQERPSSSAAATVSPQDGEKEKTLRARLPTLAATISPQDREKEKQEHRAFVPLAQLAGREFSDR
ncbi:MAG: hypothetical protein IT472_04920 [Thermomonas sp.]|uniref:hypothetical protein n=1 Tax=Thermomonas sp. TaxID=1971895 RepID=UPI00263A1C5E|nr:hypothetical protein [Thermomonas sp.]MCC7096499.1 hypothetical protein [Thermomonas sp.]